MRRALFCLVLFTPVAAALPPEFEAARDSLSLARECGLPPTRPGEPVVRVEQLPFSTAARRVYAADGVPLHEIEGVPKLYPLRAKVLEAFQTIRDVWATNPDLPPVPRMKKGPLPGRREKAGLFLTRVGSPVSSALKDDIKVYQEFPAVAMLKLESLAADLEALRPMRAREPKRWQAHFDYAVAQCASRAVFLNEYDLALGYVLREDLPELGKGHDSWKLVPAEKMLSKKAVREQADAARKRFEVLAVEHAGTPWGDLAKRELAFPSGLKWEPTAK